MPVLYIDVLATEACSRVMSPSSQMAISCLDVATTSSTVLKRRLLTAW